MHGVKYEVEWAYTSEKRSINPPSPSTIIIESARIFNFKTFFTKLDKITTLLSHKVGDLLGGQFNVLYTIVSVVKITQITHNRFIT